MLRGNCSREISAFPSGVVQCGEEVGRVGLRVQIEHVDEFIQQVNVTMRQRHECKQLSIIIDRIESYDAVDLPTDECLKVVTMDLYYIFSRLLTSNQNSRSV